VGGKSPNVVFPDADLDAAIRGATTGIFYGKGEVCAAGSRLLVDASIKAEFVDKVAARAKKMAPGDPLDPKTRLGAISSKKQLDTDLRYIDIAKREGAQLVAGGGRADIGTGDGYFLGPTIFDGVTPEMTIAREEIFGPVLSVIRVKDLDQAIELVNRSPFGNTTSIFTSDGKSARDYAARVEAGMVGVNIGVAAPMAFFPFSGWKQSFFGDLHAHGRDAIQFYTEQKVIMTRWV